MFVKKEKITITLENDEIEDFWDIIMFALDYDSIIKKSKNTENYPLNESKIKLANKLKEISQPIYD